MQAIVDQRTTDLTIHLPATRQLAADLTGDQVGAIEPLRLERGPERPLNHVPASQSHHFDEAALCVPDVGPGAEAADLEGLDPARARQ